MPLTQAERSQRRRDKKKKNGLVKVEVWVKPGNVAKMKRYEALLSSV